MATRIDPTLMDELKTYGAVGIEKCFNCGNCTAICPLTNDDHPFPRNMIRLAQLGLKEPLSASVDPWLCYYCGDCSITCPRSAEPAETMMATRRWLTAQYDRSGHGKRLYTSEKAVWITIGRIALITFAFFVLYLSLGWGNIITDRVALNSFAPVMLIWAFVLLHFLYLGIRLFLNTINMIKLVMNPAQKEGPIPLSSYLGELKTLVIHFLTQKRWRDCGPDANQRWFKHLLLVTGYVTMLVLVVGLLWWFQTDNIYPFYHPQRWLGYYATIVLIYTSADALIGRWRKQEQPHRFSQPTDWLFPAFILIGSITGILVHIFRYVGWPWPTYVIYVIHVMAMIAMLDTEVGIGKWSHLIYRPLAMYLDAVKIRAKQEREAAAGAFAPAD
jgi:quinone-modifying oxidoreductase, subunit QmoC